MLATREEPMTAEDRAIVSRQLQEHAEVNFLGPLWMTLAGIAIFALVTGPFKRRPVDVPWPTAIVIVATASALTAAGAFCLLCVRVSRDRKRLPARLMLQNALERGTVVVDEVAADAAWLFRITSGPPLVLLRTAVDQYFISEHPMPEAGHSENYVPSRFTIRRLPEPRGQSLRAVIASESRPIQIQAGPERLVLQPAPESAEPTPRLGGLLHRPLSSADLPPPWQETLSGPPAGKQR